MNKNKNPEENYPWKAIRVLIVDDNDAFRKVVSRFLTDDEQGRIGRVRTAKDELDTLAQARALQPHVVLVDMDFPKRVSLEIIRQLRSLLPEAVILATTLHDAFALQFCRETASAFGADDVLLKSTLIAELFPAIERHLPPQARDLALVVSYEAHD